jgi:hypothetical protein
MNFIFGLRPIEFLILSVTAILAVLYLSSPWNVVCYVVILIASCVSMYSNIRKHKLQNKPFQRVK